MLARGVSSSSTLSIFYCLFSNQTGASRGSRLCDRGTSPPRVAGSTCGRSGGGFKVLLISSSCGGDGGGGGGDSGRGSGRGSSCGSGRGRGSGSMRGGVEPLAR